MICPIDAKTCPYYDPKGGSNTCTFKNLVVRCWDYIPFEDDEKEEEKK